MKSRWIPLVVGGCNAVGVALLALSVTAGGSAVRAAGEVTVDSVALEPLMKLADVFSQRIARIEASVAAVREQLTAAKRIAAQELCVSDESGAQTCITKAQLDALLKGAVRTAQDAAEPAPPVQPAPSAASSSCPEKCVAPDAVAAAAPSETPAPPVVTEATAKDAPAIEAAGNVAKEVGKEPAPSEPSTAAATEPPAPAAVPVSVQPQATAYEPAETVEAVIPTPHAKPEEAKPEEAKPEETKPEEARPEATAVVTVAEPAQATTGLAAQDVAPAPKADPVAPEPRE